MFYDIQLLTRQGNGLLPIAWLSATRGVKYVSKEINNADVVALCDALLTFIMSNSRTPKHRLSLMLASKLSNGVVRIYGQQVTNFLDAVVKFLCLTRMPSYLEKSLGSESGSVVRKPKKPALKSGKEPRSRISEEAATPRAEKETNQLPEFPEITDEVLAQELASMQAHPDSITLRDEIAYLPEEMHLDTYDIRGSNNVPEPAQETVIEPRAKDSKRMSKKRKHSPEQRRTIVVTADVHVDAEQRTQRQTAVEIIEQQPQEVIGETAEPASVIDPVADLVAAPAEVHGAAELPVEEPALHRRQRAAANLALRPVPRRRRKAPVGEMYYNVWDSVEDRETLKNRQYLEENSNLVFERDQSYMTKVLSIFYGDDQQPPEFLEQVLERMRSSGRKISSLQATSSGIPERGSSLLEQVTPVALAVSKPLTQSVVPEEVMQVIREEDVPPIVPITEDFQIILPVEEPLPAVQPPVEESMITGEIIRIQPIAESTGIQQSRTDETDAAPQRLPVLHETPKKGPSDEEERRKRIIGIMRRWDYEENGYPTIDDLCRRPVNRLNIAKTFVDLLFLNKMGYLVMIPYENSNDLKHIKPTKKLLR